MLAYNGSELKKAHALIGPSSVRTKAARVNVEGGREGGKRRRERKDGGGRTQNKEHRRKNLEERERMDLRGAELASLEGGLTPLHILPEVICCVVLRTLPRRASVKKTSSFMTYSISVVTIPLRYIKHVTTCSALLARSVPEFGNRQCLHHSPQNGCSLFSGPERTDSAMCRSNDDVPYVRPHPTRKGARGIRFDQLPSTSALCLSIL
jgi:hypothetical protein